VCGSASKKRVLVTIDIGRVSKTDSLFGFDFAIEYNPDKVKFTDGIYINTLSEFFEMKDVSFGIEPGLMTGYAIQFNPYLPPVYGDKHLIGFLGTYLGDCPDTTIVKLKYLEFTDEYKNKIAEFIPDTIEAVVADKEERMLGIEFDKDSLVFESDSIIKVDIIAEEYEDSRLEFFTVEIGNLDKDSFEYEVNELSQLLTIDQYIERENEIMLKCSTHGNIDKENILEFQAERKENIDAEFDINIFATELNECTCISRLKGDTIRIKSYKKDDTTNITEKKINDLRYYYDKANVEYYIECRYLIENIKVYNVNGTLKSKIMNINNKYIRINADGWPKGCYPALIKMRNRINKILLIKY
jgi:hypothetical protein